MVIPDLLVNIVFILCVVAAIFGGESRRRARRALRNLSDHPARPLGPFGGR